jgi:hypothetical protein
MSRFSVKLVRGSEFNERGEESLRRELRSVFGEDVAVEIQYVGSLDQSPAGKYRFAICNV